MMCSRRPELAVSSARQPPGPAMFCKTNLIACHNLHSGDRRSVDLAVVGPVREGAEFVIEHPLPLLFDKLDQALLALRGERVGAPFLSACSGSSETEYFAHFPLAFVLSSATIVPSERGVGKVETPAQAQTLFRQSETNPLVTCRVQMKL
jgi:hypothetical protein